MKRLIFGLATLKRRERRAPRGLCLGGSVRHTGAGWNGNDGCGESGNITISRRLDELGWPAVADWDVWLSEPSVALAM
jgi:hypothetical protein